MNLPILRLSVNFRIDVFFDLFMCILAEPGCVTSKRGLGFIYMKLMWLYGYGMTWKNTHELCYYRNVMCMLFRKLLHLFDGAMSGMVMAIILVSKKKRNKLWPSYIYNLYEVWLVKYLHYNSSDNFIQVRHIREFLWILRHCFATLVISQAWRHLEP